MQDFIEIYDNSISDNLIQNYLDYWKDNKDQFGKGYTWNAAQQKSIYQPEIKDSVDLSARHLPQELIDPYYQSLQLCLNKYLEKYQFANEVATFDMVEPYLFQIYKPGGGFPQWHCEQSGDIGIVRHLVFMTYLNTIEEDDFGGGTEFYYQNKKIKAVSGRTVIWPTAFTHTHRGIISKSSEKFILTGWYSFN